MTDMNDSAPIEARKEWDDVADEVVAAILEKLKPVLQKASESIYEDLLYTAQDYLIDNVRWNIRSTIDAADRQAFEDRRALTKERETVADLVSTMRQMKEGWTNVVELGIIKPNHVGSAEILRDNAFDAIKKATAQ